MSGSATLQCHRNNGTCVCLEGIGGDKCDKCARGYLGNAPECHFCGECFKNWNDILEDLTEQSERMIAAAANIKETGVQGAYTREFLMMENVLKDVQNLLRNTNTSAQELATTEKLITPLREKLTEAAGKLNKTSEALETTEQQIKWVDIDLSELRTQMKNLLDNAQALRDNATKLQEANVEGALNLTRKAQKQSQEAEFIADNIQNTILVNSERQCKRTLNLYNRSIDEVNTMQSNNERLITVLQERLDGLYDKIPELNEKVSNKVK